MSDDRTLSINGRRAAATPGRTVLDAARAVGVDIPTLCHDPALEATAQCRLCLVEIEGVPRLEPACATPARPGMVVTTHGPEAAASRRQVLEMLLSRHPRECPSRARGLTCRLCDYAEEYHVSAPRLGYGAPCEPVPQNGLMELDPSVCIRCEKCVRVCSEVQGIGALTMIGRGSRKELAAGSGTTLADTDCELCGNCVEVCPTGAIRGRHATQLAHARKVATTCGFCGVGCQLELNVHEGRVVGVTAGGDNPVNGKWLCVKGRFGHEFIHHPERLTTPLIRKDGRLVPATWDEALTLVASRMTAAKLAHGPDALAFMSSSRCTNEENYLMQKLARAVIGTHNVDQCART